MNYLPDVKKLIESALNGDSSRVIQLSETIASKLFQSGEPNLAESIRNTLETASQATSSTSLVNLPYDQESRLQLADMIYPGQIEESMNEVFLNRINESKLYEWIECHKRHDLFTANGLDLPASVLFYGPPGCGKTLTAKLIAKELGLPLILVRLDTLISSYLGSTAKNIRKIFDHASKLPCVLFLDELDAIAKLRDDQQELGELKRVVNSLLQNIDLLPSTTILVGATNHANLLDTAVWRRFETRFELGLPTAQQRLSYIEYILTKHHQTISKNEIEVINSLYEGFSLADIKQMMVTSFRKSILRGNQVRPKDFSDAFFEYINANVEFSDETEYRRHRINFLLTKAPNLTNRSLSELLGCHHTTIGRDKELMQPVTY